MEYFASVMDCAPGIFLFSINGLFSPLEVIGWSIFILLFLYALSAPSRVYSIALAGLITILIIVGYLLSDRAHQNSQEWILRVFATIVVWGVTYLSLTYKMMNDQVAKQKERLNAIFDNAQEGMIVTNKAGEIVMMNSHAEFLFGYTQNELIGKSVDKLLPKELRVRHKTHRDRYIEFPINRQMGESKELQALRKDGSHFPVEISLGNFTIDDNLHTIAFIIDITRRKAAEKILMKEKGLTQMYFDIAPVIFLILDINGCVKRINRFGCKVLGYAEAELLGKNWFDTVLPNEEKVSVKAVFDQILASNLIESHDNFVHAKDGQPILIRWKNEIIKDESGKLVSILSAGEDITEIKKKEKLIQDHYREIQALNEELEGRVKKRTSELTTTLKRLEKSNLELEGEILQRKEFERKLEDRQKLYGIMAHRFPKGIIGILDKDLRYILVDGAELKHLDLSTESLMGQRIFDDLYPQANEEAEAKLKMAFDGDTINFEMVVDDKPYIINAVPLPDANDVVSEILVVIINNSDVKRMEEDLRRNLEKEKELNELKSRFVTMASHEFRTPLSTILSSVFLLEKYEGREFDEKKYKHIERIKKTIYNLTEILNDFLSLGKFEEGKIHVSSEPVDIENLIADVIKEMTEVRKAEQTISYTHQGNPIIYSDKILLRNIIVNLLFNSIKYSAAGSKIEIISNTADGVFSMHVSDNGIGIPEESQPHIFNRFYRAGNANNVQGTGLGLHLVKKYTELLNGEVSFKSKAGVGTTFTINLKLEEQSNKNINEIHTADRRQ